jgi:hypothetical protein
MINILIQFNNPLAHNSMLKNRIKKIVIKAKCKHIKNSLEWPLLMCCESCCEAGFIASMDCDRHSVEDESCLLEIPCHC